MYWSQHFRYNKSYHKEALSYSNEMMIKELKKLGFCGAFVWLLLSILVILIYYGEYQERENSQRSYYKVAVIFCTGNIIGTGVATTAAIFLVGNIMAVRAKYLASKLAKKS